MIEVIEKFERITRSIEKPSDSQSVQHPFDVLNIHPEIQRTSRSLFDDGYFSLATFEAFKFIENKVQIESGMSNFSGQDLMMKAFDENNGKIKLRGLISTTSKNEQMGYKFIFAGSMSAIRNPRAHKTASKVNETSEECLDHLVLASFLVKTLDKAQTSIALSKPKSL